MERLGNHIEITNGYAFKSSKYSENGSRIIRITNVQKGIIEDNNPKYYNLNDLEKLERYEIDKGDILMSLTGNVGRVGVFPKELLPAYINQRVCRLKSRSDKLIDNYLFHILNSNEFEERAINSSTGIAQLNLSTKWIEEFKIPLPSIKTQKQIAQTLDDAAALRDKTKQLLTEYDLLSQSIFLDMFGDPEINPKGWLVKKLAEVCNKITDGTHQGPKFKTKGIPFLLVSNIVNNEIIYETKKYIDDDEYSKLTKSTKIEVGDLLYTSVGSYGNPAIVKDKRKFCFQRHIAHLKPNSQINLTFLHAMMKSPLIKRQADKFAIGVAQKTLNLKTIRNFDIFYPSIELQNQFAEKIELIDQQKALAKQELQESEDLFNCLLQKAFKGELV
jgi:type I restriction enzyme S subunit